MSHGVRLSIIGRILYGVRHERSLFRRHDPSRRTLQSLGHGHPYGHDAAGGLDHGRGRLPGHGDHRLGLLQEVRTGGQGRSLGARTAGQGENTQNPSPAHPQPLHGRVPAHSSRRAAALARTPGSQRHQRSPDLGPLQHALGVDRAGPDGNSGRPRHHRQPDFLHLAQAHRRLLRGAHPGGRQASGEAHLPQGPGRPAHAGPHPLAGPGSAGERRRHPGGVPHPLQQRPGAAVHPRRHRGRYPHHQRGAAALVGRIVEPVAVQHHPERPRPGLSSGHRRGAPGAGFGAFHAGGEAGGLPHRRAASL